MEEKSLELETAQQRIHILRGARVILDLDLSLMYGVSTKRLNEQVRRNLDRFPEDFMFQLSDQEVTDLRSQFATSKIGRGGVGTSHTLSRNTARLWPPTYSVVQ